MPILDSIFFKPVLFLLAVWSLYWKGRALWRAAKRNEKKWFLALLLVNTLGILEILYLRVWGKDKKEQS
ncbi:MAG: DUF5652 family protein [bacterium]|nr:DUF5652 family protein [bacterium]